MRLSFTPAIRRFFSHHMSWCLGGLLLALLALDMAWLHSLAGLDQRLLDFMLRQQASYFQPDPEIVVIDIDDQSMTEMQELAGLWVWRREIHATLIEALAEFKPRALLFDLNFHEQDKAHPQSDLYFSQQVCTHPWIYLQTLQITNSEAQSKLNTIDLYRAFAVNASSATEFYRQIQLPFAVDQKCWRLGLVNGLVDDDGVMRRSLIRREVAGVSLPSLSSRVLQDLALTQPATEEFYLRWTKRNHRHFSYGALYKILTEQRAQLSPEQWSQLQAEFANKILVLGSSASGAFDYHLTPMNPGYPGVDILALALDNLKNKNYILPYPAWYSWLIALLLMIAVNWAFQRGVTIAKLAACLLLASLLLIGLAYQRLWQDRILFVASSLLLNCLNFAFLSALAYLRERRSRDRAVNMFGRFLNPAIVKSIVEHGATVDTLSGQQKRVTVLFSDIRGFTSLSEYHSAEEVVKLLNRYYEKQVEIIWRHGGTLDKFIGDCIMAFWGAPVDDPLQVDRALACALEMQEGLMTFKAELSRQDATLPDFDIGIGIHTGTAVVGFIGAARKLDYTAIGDTVNLASRVEGLTKGVARILVTSSTRDAANSGEFEFIPHGSFKVKGRVAEVDLFQPQRKN